MRNLLLLLCMLPGLAAGASVSVTCTPPSARSDGSPLPASEIAGYIWFVDGVRAGESDACAFTVTGPDGEVSIQAVTKDTGGRVSQLSAAKKKELITAPPLPPVLN